MVTKFIGVWPFTKMFYMGNREANYTTLLMSTGLTFGTISALFGLQNKIIDQIAIHRAGDGGHFERVCANSHCAEVFPADH